MNPEDIKPGMLVEYGPRPGHWFPAVVAGEPRKLGTEWVVRLEGLGEQYALSTGRYKSTVAAAAVDCLRMRMGDG